MLFRSGNFIVSQFFLVLLDAFGNNVGGPFAIFGVFSALSIPFVPPGQGPKAAKYAVLAPGPGMFVNVRNAPRVVIPPPSETPRVSPCVPLCAIL